MNTDNCTLFFINRKISVNNEDQLYRVLVCEIRIPRSVVFAADSGELSILYTKKHITSLSFSGWMDIVKLRIHEFKVCVLIKPYKKPVEKEHSLWTWHQKGQEK